MITFSMIIIWIVYFLLLYLMIFWLIVFIEEGIEDTPKKLTKTPLVTIAIPAWNEEHTVIETLESALALDYPHDKLEILVINDGSTDHTREVVEKYIAQSKRAITLINQENKGKGAALNNAARKAKGEIFIPFDADSLIRSDALQKLLPEFEEHEDIAAVLPLMKVWKPKTFIQKIQWAEYMVNLFYKKLMSHLDCVSVAPGPFSAYRKKHFLAIGGFDEHNLTEDLNISLRLQQHHYKLVQVFTTEVYTKAPSTFAKFYNQRNRWYKGTILNAVTFKNMAFNKKYGDFGMIQMPRLLLESIVVVLIAGLVLYSNIFVPLWTKLKMLYFSNFNLLPSVQWGIDNFKFIDVNYTNIFYTIMLMVFAAFLLYYAHKACKEPLTKEGYLVIPSYLLLYGLMATIVLVGVFVDLARGKKQRW